MSDHDLTPDEALSGWTTIAWSLSAITADSVTIRMDVPAQIDQLRRTARAYQAIQERSPEAVSTLMRRVVDVALAAPADRSAGAEITLSAREVIDLASPAEAILMMSEIFPRVAAQLSADFGIDLPVLLAATQPLNAALRMMRAHRAAWLEGRS